MRAGGRIMKKASKHVVVGVHITDRVHRVKKVQQVFTEYGCQIKTRIGLHDADESFCSPNGLILLEMVGADKTIAEMIAKLRAIAGVEVKKIVFAH
jgi:hypothetical protein